MDDFIPIKGYEDYLISPKGIVFTTKKIELCIHRLTKKAIYQLNS